MPRIAIAAALLLISAPWLGPAIARDATPGSPPAGAARAPARIGWSEARAAIAETICMWTTDQGDQITTMVPVLGRRGECHAPPAETALARSVDKAFADAGALLSSIPPESIQPAFAPDLSLQERTRRVREAYLGSDPFLRIIVPRLVRALALEGIGCAGCPNFEIEPPREIRWVELVPYVTSFVWPDPVSTPGPAGSPEAPRYSFHICTGSNGVDLMRNPDPLLVRAGFAGAMMTREIRERADLHFKEILSEEAFRKLGDDEARTRYLRRRLPETLSRDDVVRTSVCRTLGGLTIELGLKVTDCAAAARN